MSAALNQAFLQHSKIVNADGTPSFTFFQFLLSLWKKTGSGFIQNINAAYLQQLPSGAGVPIEVRKAEDGSLIGTISIANVGGGPAEPQVLTVSPFTYTAVVDGTLVVFAGAVDISRDGGSTWYQVSLTGCPVPLLKNDKVRVTWYGADLPVVTYLPIQ